jgi:serine protease Do
MTGGHQMKARQKWRGLSAGRLTLLATTALGLSGAALLIAPSVSPKSEFANAQSVARAYSFADIVERVKPAVFAVRVKIDAGPQTRTESPDSNMDEFLRRFGPPTGRGPIPPRGPTSGQGSGFFISADGYAVTNNHVVDKASSVQIVTDDGKIYNAKVVGTDQRTDLALIKVDGGKFPFVTFADKPPRIGDAVLAVGNPFGLGGTVTAGILSARGRDIGSGPYDDFIQIDAAVNRGNSGGPTFDVDGNVIGVNTAIFSPSGGSVGIAFAIPADTVKAVIAQLKDKGSVTRGWIGVQVQAVTPEVAESLGLKKAEGALVTEPQADGPAAKAGIQAGDIVTSVNGAAIKDSRDLARKIAALAPGATVQLAIWQKGSEKNVTLTLGELPNVRESRTEPVERGQRRRGGPEFRGGSEFHFGPNREEGHGGDMRGERDEQRGDMRRERGERRGESRDERGRQREEFRDERNDMRGERFGQREEFRSDRGDQRTQRGERRDRGGERGDRSAQRDDMPRLGLSLSAGQNGDGVVVAAVEPDSTAAVIGFQAGDVIVDVGGKAVSSPADVRNALLEARAEGKRSVLMRVKAQGGTRMVTVPLASA